MGVIIPILLLLIGLFLAALGAFVITNAICRATWKEKIPQSKLIGFASVFTVCFVLLEWLMLAAGAIVFGR